MHIWKASLTFQKLRLFNWTRRRAHQGHLYVRGTSPTYINLLFMTQIRTQNFDILTGFYNAVYRPFPNSKH